MSVETVARRYAIALADVVIAAGNAETVKGEIDTFAQLLEANADLHAAMTNPAIAHVNKEKVLEQLIARTKPSQVTGNFLRVLLKNNRLSEAAEISRRFAAVLEERSGIISAEIISARELPEDERTAFQSTIEKLTGKRAKISYAIDQELIGGAVARVGSTVYDGSVRTKLENLREQLVNG